MNESGGRHARPHRTALALGVAGICLLIAAGIVYVVIRWPNLGVHNPATAVCRYSSASVTVEVTGPDCAPVMRSVVQATDRIWVFTKTSRGEEFSQLGKGPDTVRVYEAGDAPFAGMVSDFFQKAGWSPETMS